jgi:hypothetical protein
MERSYVIIFTTETNLKTIYLITQNWIQQVRVDTILVRFTKKVEIYTLS